METGAGEKPGGAERGEALRDNVKKSGSIFCVFFFFLMWVESFKVTYTLLQLLIFTGVETEASL